jgi:hypothetical protein
VLIIPTVLIKLVQFFLDWRRGRISLPVGWHLDSCHLWLRMVKSWDYVSEVELFPNRN